MIRARDVIDLLPGGRLFFGELDLPSGDLTLRVATAEWCADDDAFAHFHVHRRRRQSRSKPRAVFAAGLRREDSSCGRLDNLDAPDDVSTLPIAWRTNNPDDPAFRTEARDREGCAAFIAAYVPLEDVQQATGLARHEVNVTHGCIAGTGRGGRVWPGRPDKGIRVAVPIDIGHNEHRAPKRRVGHVGLEPRQAVHTRQPAGPRGALVDTCIAVVVLAVAGL